MGAVGVTGCALIITSVEEGDIQPDALVTVNVQVPVIIPVTVLVVPVPMVVTAPGERVRVHVPVAGNPLRVTLPVDDAQVG